jgi:hypothetical protein
VIVIPRHLATAIAQPAAEQEELERFLLEKVAAGAPLPGCAMATCSGNQPKAQE